MCPKRIMENIGMKQKNTSAAYFKMFGKKLMVIYLVSSVFVTCIIKHLRNFDARSPEIHQIIIYSDGCFYQNRNFIWSHVLLACSKETDISINIHTYIIGHYNPSVRIIDLVSHTTYVVCVNFIHKWRNLQFKVDSERQIF